MRVLLIMCLIALSTLKIYADTSIGTIIVSPNRSSMEIDKTGSSVSFIDNEEIESSASTTTSGLLQEYGGFTVATKGNKGSDPSYFNRGLPRKYIRVLVDGMDLSDVSAAGEEPTFIDYINLNNTKNIEILNGSQGTLYGSNAIGGVISINSKKAEKIGFSNDFLVEGGTYDSIKTSKSVKYLGSKTNFVLNIDGERSNGYNSFVYNEQPLEKDGYYLYGTNFLSSFKLNKDLKITFNGKYINQHNDYDDAYSNPGDSSVHYRYDKQYAGLLDISFDKNNYVHKISYQPTYTNRINVLGGRYEYDGKRDKLEYLFKMNLKKNLKLLNGFEFMKIKTNIEGLESSKEVNSVFSEILYSPIKQFSLNASARREYDSYYDSHDTGRIQLNYKLNNIIFRSSIGSGYRSPTASQLFNKTYGNKKLKPEKSLSKDVSAELLLSSVPVNIFLEAYENIIEDIITAPAPTYVNQQSIESLKTKGMESRIKIFLSDTNSLAFSFSRILGKQQDGDSITLVPKNKIRLNLNTMIFKHYNVNTYYLYQNKSKDLKFNDLPLYRSLNLNVRYRKKDLPEFYIKAENLLNRKNIVNRAGTSSNNLGFKSSDRAIYFGIKL